MNVREAKFPAAKRVALLTNFLPHYRVPLLLALNPLVGELRIFLSSRIEKDRNWPVFWDSLDVVVQKSISWTRNFRNIHGYRDSSQIHIPYDTFAQLRRFKPDAIISGELGSRTLMSVLYRMAVPRTILIVWATLSDHTEATRGPIRTILRRWIIRRVDGAFVNGKGGARYLKSLGFTGPLFTIPYVVDNAAFADERPPRNEDALHLFFAGQLIERKGLHLFLPVLSQWSADHPARRVTLSVAGDGPDKARIESIALPPNFTLQLLGNIAPDQLPSHYRAADIFVFPTLGDEWGTVVNEALSAGTPVLGSIYSQAVEELIIAGENGWLFNPTDPADTYNALELALKTDRDISLAAMSEHARASITTLAPQIVAASMAGAIHELANRQTKSQPQN